MFNFFTLLKKKKKKKRMDAIQIHMTNSHWVTSLRHRETVTLLDCRKVAGELSSTPANQLCQVYRTSIRECRGNSFLAVNVAAVQMQRGMGLWIICDSLHIACCFGSLHRRD